MQYAHDVGVIHRDLKPDNIMVEINPPGSTLKKRIKILDFGIARVVASAVDPTGSGMVLGTARFMAPEQATNSADVSGRADVFALAQILYLLLTGTMPWGIPESDMAIYHKQRTESPAWPPEQLVPRSVASVIMRCLSLDPDDRPTMRELAIDLACAIPGEEGLESGVQMLEKVVPDWVTSSAPDAVTLPRSAVADPTDGAPQLQSGDKAIDDNRDRAPASLSPDPRAPEAQHASSPARSRRPSRHEAETLNVRPRGHASSAASAARAALNASASTPVAGAQSLSGTTIPESSALSSASSSPVLATLPTGLTSQKYAAQDPAVLEAMAALEATHSPRLPSVTVAAEIELATGTPGPQPFAHAELPRVLVSNTQLSGVNSPGRTHASRASAEPPPILVLPVAARARSRRHLALLAAGAVAVAVVACLLVMWRDSSRGARSSDASTAPSHGSDGILADPGAAAFEPRVATPVQINATTGTPKPQVAAGPPTNAPTAASEPPVPAPLPTDAGHRSSTIVAHDTSTQPLRAAGDAKTSATSLEGAARDKAASSGQRGPSTPEAAQPGESRPAAQTSSPTARKGELVIEVDTWAIIWLNGTKDEAPYRAKMGAGRYRLRMQHEEKDETMTVVVRPGETTTVRRNW